MIINNNNRKVAIITARGGSKRIPQKNIKEFCGKPIIFYSIDAAINSGLFNRVMVSTDDETIAELASSRGAEVPFMRSSENSDDYATTADVIKEVLAKYADMDDFFEYVCCIYPTAPFITADLLRNGFNHLKSENADTLIPVVRFSYPPQRAFVERDRYLVFCNPENERVRSQDLEPMYHDAGQFYFFRVNSFRESGSLLSGKIAYIELPETKVQDIDNEVDWKLAELKYSIIS